MMSYVHLGFALLFLVGIALAARERRWFIAIAGVVGVNATMLGAASEAGLVPLWADNVAIILVVFILALGTMRYYRQRRQEGASQ